MDTATRDTIKGLNALRVQLSHELLRMMTEHTGELPDSVKLDAFNNSMEQMMIGFHVRYLKRSNPLYLWLAYNEARRFKWPVPEWFFRYLDESAQAIADAVDLPGKRGLGWPSLVAGAFGLDDARKRTSFRRSHGDFFPRSLDQDTMKRLKTDPWGHLPPAQRNHVYVLRYVEQGMTRKEALKAAHEESGVPEGTLEADYDHHKSLTLRK